MVQKKQTKSNKFQQAGNILDKLKIENDRSKNFVGEIKMANMLSTMPFTEKMNGQNKYYGADCKPVGNVFSINQRVFEQNKRSISLQSDNDRIDSVRGVSQGSYSKSKQKAASQRENIPSKDRSANNNEQASFRITPLNNPIPDIINLSYRAKQTKTQKLAVVKNRFSSDNQQKFEDAKHSFKEQKVGNIAEFNATLPLPQPTNAFQKLASDKINDVTANNSYKTPSEIVEPLLTPIEGMPSTASNYPELMSSNAQEESTENSQFYA